MMKISKILKQARARTRLTSLKDSSRLLPSRLLSAFSFLRYSDRRVQKKYYFQSEFFTSSEVETREPKKRL